MNLPHKLPEIDVFLTDNGLKSILEKRTMTPVTTIKTDRLSGQQSRHDLRKACGPRANEKVGMVGQNRPRRNKRFLWLETDQQRDPADDPGPDRP